MGIIIETHTHLIGLFSQVVVHHLDIYNAVDVIWSTNIYFMTPLWKSSNLKET